MARPYYPEIPAGLCQCGCGEPAQIARSDSQRDGTRKGEPMKYAKGHYRKGTPAHIRFWRYVEKTETCWLWIGTPRNPKDPKNAYGMFGMGGRVHRAHRVAWLLTYGPIPDGLEVLHNCPGGDNPRCVNPAHLWLGTQTENMRDAVAKGRKGTQRRRRHWMKTQRYYDDLQLGLFPSPHELARKATLPYGPLTVSVDIPIIADGECNCGCGEPVAMQTKDHGPRKPPIGTPLKYARGHNVRVPALIRFWKRVRQTDGCWLWTGGIIDRRSKIHSYGVFWPREGERILAHRYMWELIYGPIPEGLFVLHHCNTPRCVRIDHLFLGTRTDNFLDAQSQGRAPWQLDRYRLARWRREHPHQGSRFRLTPTQVRAIRAAYETTPAKQLAETYGVTPRTIYEIWARKTWQNI